MKLENIIPEEHQETLITYGFRMENQKYSIENDHSFVSIGKELRNTDVYNHCVVVQKKKNKNKKVFISGDRVKLHIVNNKVMPVLKGIELKGMPKVSVLKRVLEASDVVDMYTLDGWDTYIAVFNNNMYKFGFHNGEYGLVGYMRVYTPRRDYNEPSTDEYYKVWKERNSKRHTYTEYHEKQLSDEVYGDHASGLGSVFTESVRNELQDAIEFIYSVKDDPEYGDLIDDLREILDLNAEDTNHEA